MIEEIREPAKPDAGTPAPTPHIIRTPGVSAHCMWVVQAGVVPDLVEPDYFRQWILTSEAYRAPGGEEKFLEFRSAAYDYAKEVSDPGRVNWVKVEFIYF